MATVATDSHDPAAAPRRPLVWRLVSVAGELLITLGVVLLLLVAYELWWTNVVTGQAVDQQRQDLVESWAADPIDVEAQAIEAPAIPSEAFGLMYIPRLQSDVWGYPLIEGVTDPDLAKGIGHFPESALPGQTGNTAFAGHRATNGEPLRAIDQLQAGDMVYIQTGVGWYSYRLTGDQIVQPTDVWVVDPVPGAPAGTAPTEGLITLITCHPRWGSTERWVWWGELDQIRTRSQGPPTELAALLDTGEGA